MMKIGGLQKTTLIDYPGKVACTVFLSGCNFFCPWCYAPHLVLSGKTKRRFSSNRKEISFVEEILKKDFFKFLKERKGLLDGVVICGGEPTINKELSGFIEKIKELGYFVKLDTNGSNPEVLEKLIKKNAIDYVAMDIKAPLESNKYDRAAGIRVDLDKIKKSIEIIKSSGIDYEFRTTVVPLFHKKEDIIKIARDIKPAKKYCLQNFRPEETINSELKTIKPYPKEFFAEVKKEISDFFDVCEIRD